jgi:hypothetical protein
MSEIPQPNTKTPSRTSAPRPNRSSYQYGKRDGSRQAPRRATQHTPTTSAPASTRRKTSTRGGCYSDYPAWRSGGDW